MPQCSGVSRVYRVPVISEASFLSLPPFPEKQPLLVPSGCGQADRLSRYRPGYKTAASSLWAPSFLQTERKLAPSRPKHSRARRLSLDGMPQRHLRRGSESLCVGSAHAQTRGPGAVRPVHLQHLRREFSEFRDLPRLFRYNKGKDSRCAPARHPGSPAQSLPQQPGRLLCPHAFSRIPKSTIDRARTPSRRSGSGKE